MGVTKEEVMFEMFHTFQWRFFEPWCVSIYRVISTKWESMISSDRVEGAK